MASLPASILHGLVLSMTVSIASLAPMASVLATHSSGAEVRCGMSAAACATTNCCDGCPTGEHETPSSPGDAPHHEHHEHHESDGSESQDAPCGDPSDCPCCFTLVSGVSPAIVHRTHYSFDETPLHTAAPPTETPFFSGWRDALIRPPIA